MEARVVSNSFAENVAGSPFSLLDNLFIFQIYPKRKSKIEKLAEQVFIEISSKKRETNSGTTQNFTIFPSFVQDTKSTTLF